MATFELESPASVSLQLAAAPALTKMAAPDAESILVEKAHA